MNQHKVFLRKPWEQKLLFKCINYLNDPETVKSHLTEHALRPKENTIRKLLPNKLKKAVLQAGDFTDLYYEKGNPLYESTDSEASDAE